jgi:hypothetical protein
MCLLGRKDGLIKLWGGKKIRTLFEFCLLRTFGEILVMKKLEKIFMMEIAKITTKFKN